LKIVENPLTATEILKELPFDNEEKKENHPPGPFNKRMDSLD
jgi:hypothetical protein